MQSANKLLLAANSVCYFILQWMRPGYSYWKVPSSKDVCGLCACLCVCVCTVAIWSTSGASTRAAVHYSSSTALEVKALCRAFLLNSAQFNRYLHWYVVNTRNSMPAIRSESSQIIFHVNSDWFTIAALEKYQVKHMYLVGSLSAAPITLLESDLSVAKSISNYVRAPLLACLPYRLSASCPPCCPGPAALAGPMLDGCCCITHSLYAPPQ